MGADKGPEILASTRPMPLVGVFFLAHLTLGARAWRFGLLLDHRLPARAVLSVTAVGFMAIGVLPLRMGEVVRPVIL